MKQLDLTTCYNTMAKSLHIPIDVLAYRVTKVEEVDPIMMYDVEVEDSHEYVVNGIISHNTANMAESATVEDVANLYMMAWDYGLKSLSVYRDNSRQTQVLHTAESIEKEKPIAKPKKKKLPNDRQALTHKMDIQGVEGYLTVGLFPDGSPGEVFLNVSKQGSTVNGLTDTIGILLSYCLQYGVSVEEIVDKLSGITFEPSGMTANRDIPFASSMVDYVAKFLHKKYVDTNTAIIERVDPSKGSPTGEICSNCGSGMIRAEGCVGCPGCGYQKCG